MSALDEFGVVVFLIIAGVLIVNALLPSPLDDPRKKRRQ